MAPCRVELSDDEGDDDLEGKHENYICTLLDEDGRECGQRWPTARALAAYQRHTQGGTHGEPKGVASLVVTNQCFWCGSTHASIETTSKHMAAAERHNRWVVDAGRFHYPVIDILLTPASIETTSKHMAAAERHNRCVVDAGRFHYPVIDILLTPSAHNAISSLTTE